MKTDTRWECLFSRIRMFPVFTGKCTAHKCSDFFASWYIYCHNADKQAPAKHAAFPPIFHHVEKSLLKAFLCRAFLCVLEMWLFAFSCQFLYPKITLWKWELSPALFRGPFGRCGAHSRRTLREDHNWSHGSHPKYPNRAPPRLSPRECLHYFA